MELPQKNPDPQWNISKIELNQKFKNIGSENIKESNSVAAPKNIQLNNPTRERLISPF